MSVVYHIAVREDWERARQMGVYRVPSLDAEGFIHCSAQEQVLRSARMFFAGTSNLLLLKIDTEKLQPELRWEPGTDAPGSRFPHLYGALNLDAVMEVCPFSPEEDSLPC
jgi:uncharacterized protein (DUF952 family)